MSASGKEQSVWVVGPESVGSLFQSILQKYGYKVEVFAQPPVSIADKPSVCVVAAGVEAAAPSADTVIATLKKTLPSTCILVALGAAGGASQYEKLRRQGVEKVFFFPHEKDMILNEIFTLAPLEIPPQQLDLDAMMKVCVSDIAAAEKFPFDIFLYLSRNKKILALRKANAPVEAKLQKKAEENPNFFLLVRRGDYQKYRQRTVDKLKSLNDSELPVEKKAELVRHEVRALVHDLFGKENLPAEEGQKIVENFRQIANDYMESISQDAGAQDRLRALSAQVMSNHGHAMNMSAYCSMFGMMAGIQDLEALTLAGLMHDLGYYKLPMNFSFKTEAEMDEEELTQFKRHPVLAIEVIKERNLPVPPHVQRIIVQHHERMDGSGYPQGLKGDQIEELTKICAFADVFDELTSLHSGRPSCSPAEAAPEAPDAEPDAAMVAELMAAMGDDDENAA